MNTNSMIVAPEVANALAGGGAVVALESTIISHGLPYPRNRETALGLETVIREHGAVPATIAVIGGAVRIGIGEAELELLARNPDVVKASRRDLPLVYARGLHAATTVAGTMILARAAGIAVFATGGIGGVHRGAQNTMDISADLQELTRTDVAVVSAGAKAILDLSRTLEYLETMGVPVVGFRTDDFPAFYSRSSGLSVPWRVDSAEEAAAVLDAKWRNGLSGGVLFANPIPEPDELDRSEIESVIEEALVAAESAGVKGKELTPFLLARVAAITAGRSIDANVALVRNNAAVAAQIAVAYAGTPR